MNFFEYNGTKSSQFGLHIQSKRIFDSPTIDLSFQTIPGRDGDLILPDNRLGNVTVSYTCFFKEKNITDMADTVRQMKAWLFSCRGNYAKLTDSYDPEYFRYAVLTGSLSIDEQLNRLGSFTVTFSCKPYKYSLLGNIASSYAQTEIELTNPEPFESLPVIKVAVTTDFEVKVSSSGYETKVSFTVPDSVARYYIIDSENLNIYGSAGRLLNRYAVVSNGFPVFFPGDNTVTVTGGNIVKTVITPLWRSL